MMRNRCRRKKFWW